MSMGGFLGSKERSYFAISGACNTYVPKVLLVFYYTDEVVVKVS